MACHDRVRCILYAGAINRRPYNYIITLVVFAPALRM